MTSDLRSSTKPTCFIKRGYKAACLAPVHFPRLLHGNEPQALCDRRRSLFMQDSAKVHVAFANAWDNAYRSSLNQIARFIQSQTENHHPRHAIPTALVLAGMNVVENTRAFQILVTLLDSLPVVTLPPTATFSLKSALGSIIETLIGTDSEDADDLGDWFRSLSEPTPVPVLVPSFESCHFKVVSQLIPILAQTKVPFVLVLGIGSIPEIMHQVLDLDALHYVHATQFLLVTGTDQLDAALRDVLLQPMSNLTVSFAPQVLDWIYARFTQSFPCGLDARRVVHFALMDFYFGNPLAALAAPHPAVLDSLTPDLCELIRALPSVRRALTAEFEACLAFSTYATNTDSHASLVAKQLGLFKNIKQVLVCDQALKSKVKLWLQDLDRAVTAHIQAVKFVHAIQIYLKGLEKQSLACIYIKALHGNLATGGDDAAGVKLFLTLLRKMANDGHSPLRTVLLDIQRVLRLVCDHMVVDTLIQSTPISDEYDAHCTTMTRLLEELDASGQIPGNTQDKSDQDSDSGLRQRLSWARIQFKNPGSENLIPIARPGLLRSRMSCAGQLDKIFAGTNASPNHSALAQTELDPASDTLQDRVAQFVESVCEWLQGHLAKSLVPPTILPLSETRFQTHLNALKKTFIIQTEPIIREALSHPDQFLEYSVPESENNAEAVVVRPQDPDTSILYKIHLECGEQINLYDWYVAFKQVLTGPQGDSSSNGPDDEQTKHYYIRFIQGVNELKLLGLVKKNTRKVDHVSRVMAVKYG